MSESILSGIATELFKKLGSEALKEIELASGVKKELGKVKDSMSTIKAVLLDAEEQQATNHEVRDWLGKISDAFYEADDLLDDFNAELLQRQAMTRDVRRRKQVCIFFSSSNQIAFRVKMGRKIKAIRERFEAIAHDRHNFHFTERFVEKRVESRKREETHSFVRAEEVFGRDDDKMKIIKLLLDCNAQENVSAIAIVGIGGLGKTALAQLVYNDEKVAEYFELKIWVCVSDVFDVKLIAEKIIGSEAVGKNLVMDEVQEKVRKKIDGKKYLLVLDDMWNDNRETWLQLKRILMGGAYGSRILITTRTLKAAVACGVTSPHDLKGLSEEESWSLFKKLAFEEGKEIESQSLVKIGEEIVKNCAGVPLAIRSLGSLLYCKSTVTEWSNFKDKEMAKIGEEEDVIFPILKLSYDDLPSHLKRCFAFCSIYEKDDVINKVELIRLWIANGFIWSGDGNEEMEDVGELYIMELVRRCFFQEVKRDSDWGNIISFKMHDLMHDLAQSVSPSECSRVDWHAKEISPRTRHLSIVRLGREEFPFKSGKIRTLLMARILRFESACERIVSSFKRLRVLNLQKCPYADRLPRCVSKLKNLRYLDLSNSKGLKTLPDAITKLVNLQTLLLNGCRSLEQLPRDMRKLINLRHLELNGCRGLNGMPPGLGQLGCLQTLTDFVVGHDGASGGLSELEGLSNLRGALAIRGLGRWCFRSMKKDEEKNYLMQKKYLSSLYLKFQSEDMEEDEDESQLEWLLEGLRPHLNLKKLLIYRYRCASLPSWMSNIASCLPSLVRIEIRYSYRGKSLAGLGQLPCLQSLTLADLESLEYVEEDYNSTTSSSGCGGGRVPMSTTFFPSLKQLQLRRMPNLRGWWRSSEAENQQPQPLPSFPCLSTSSIQNCPKLASMPLHPCVERLQLSEVTEKLVIQQLTAFQTPYPSSSSSLVPLSKLHCLYIIGIHDLVTLPVEAFRSLTSLQHLHISYCPRLASLSGWLRHLAALKEMNLLHCPELDLSYDGDAMPFQVVANLTSLDISVNSKLYSLTLWLQHVTSLQSLRICDCENLKTLPEWICNVTALQELDILRCAKELHDGCRTETGEDCLNIAHIPKLTMSRWV